MAEETIFAFEQAQNRSEIAAYLRALSDQLDGDGDVTFTADDQTVTVTVPVQPTFEVEVEREQPEDEGDATESSIELEIEWDENNDELSSMEPADTDDIEDQRLRAADTDTIESYARFQVYKDRAGEWRWRLVHRNGNIIATSGEGYTSRQNAEKGMRSVMKNAPGADIVRE
jgi:amphi-Trp domain-containing protein